MDARVAIDLPGRCLENSTSQALGKAQHIDGAKHARFRRLHGIMLIMDGRGCTGEIIDFVYLNIERKSDIVADKFKARMRKQMLGDCSPELLNSARLHFA